LAAALVVTATMACIGASSTAVGSQPAQSEKVSAAGGRAPSPVLDAGVRATSGSSGNTAPSDVDKLLDVLANKNLYPIPIEGAAQKLKPVAELHRETPPPASEVTLMVGAGPALRRMQISYVLEANKKFTFSQMDVVLTAASPDALDSVFRRIESRLRKRLGKPLFVKSGDTALPQIGWKMKGDFELWLSEETSTLPGGGAPERQIQLAVAEPAGEAD